MVIHCIDNMNVMYTDILSKYITLKLRISEKEKNILILRCSKPRFYEVEDIEYEKDEYSIVTARPSLDIEGITVCEMMIFQKFAKDFADNGQAAGEYSSELKEIVLDVVNYVIDKQQSLNQEEIKALKHIISTCNYVRKVEFSNLSQKIINQYIQKEKRIYSDFAKELIRKRKTRLINLICFCRKNRIDYDKLHDAVEEAGVPVDYCIRRKRIPSNSKQESD